MMRILIAAAATALLAGTGVADERPSLRFDNGLWFDAERFVPATVFVQYGQLRFAKSKKDARAPAEQVIDLAGRHVTAPFCEAHNHNLGLADEADNERFTYRYLRDGVFYVKLLSNLRGRARRFGPPTTGRRASMLFSQTAASPGRAGIRFGFVNACWNRVFTKASRRRRSTTTPTTLSIPMRTSKRSGR